MLIKVCFSDCYLLSRIPWSSSAHQSLSICNPEQDAGVLYSNVFCMVLADGPHAQYLCRPPYAPGTHLCCRCVGPVLEYPAHGFWAPRAMRVGPKARGAQRRVVQATSEPWLEGYMEEWRRNSWSQFCPRDSLQDGAGTVPHTGGALLETRNWWIRNSSSVFRTFLYIRPESEVGNSEFGLVSDYQLIERKCRYCRNMCTHGSRVCTPEFGLQSFTVAGRMCNRSVNLIDGLAERLMYLQTLGNLKADRVLKWTFWKHTIIAPKNLSENVRSHWSFGNHKYLGRENRIAQLNSASFPTRPVK